MPLTPSTTPQCQVETRGGPGGCSSAVGAWGSGGWSLTLITATAAEAGSPATAPVPDSKEGALRIHSDLEDILEIHTPPPSQHYSDPLPQ